MRFADDSLQWKWNLTFLQPLNPLSDTLQSSNSPWLTSPIFSSRFSLFLLLCQLLITNDGSSQARDTNFQVEKENRKILSSKLKWMPKWNIYLKWKWHRNVCPARDYCSKEWNENRFLCWRMKKNIFREKFVFFHSFSNIWFVCRVRLHRLSHSQEWVRTTRSYSKMFPWFLSSSKTRLDFLRLRRRNSWRYKREKVINHRRYILNKRKISRIQ